MTQIDTDPARAEALLAGAQFFDCFEQLVAGQNLNAEQAARRAMGRSPVWVQRLLQLRHGLVAPFGLKAPRNQGAGSAEVIGPFPVLSRAEQQLVMGLDDRHLDFRLEVRVSEMGAGLQKVTALTVVRTRNLAGRLYLAVVLPFHRRIVPVLLAQVTRA